MNYVDYLHYREIKSIEREAANVLEFVLESGCIDKSGRDREIYIEDIELEVMLEAQRRGFLPQEVNVIVEFATAYAE